MARLRELLGRADPAVRPLALGIRWAARRHFDRAVAPLVRAHWPALEGERFYQKLLIGACDLYASAPYTALFSSPRRPPLVRAVTALGNALPLPTGALAALARAAVTLLGRFAYQAEQRRIALIAAFIVVVDHVFDHCMDDPPDDRAARVAAVLDGTLAPDGPELALVRALSVAMSRGLSREERADFDAAMARVHAWLRAEVKGMNGEPDPRGLGHRLEGVEGTIDGLLFPVARFAGEPTRRWMYGVSLFVQMADDWLDAELDARWGRTTPVLQGAWTWHDVESAWRGTLSGIEDLTRGAGLASPGYVRFVREAYALMMTEVLEAMIQRPDE